MKKEIQIIKIINEYQYYDKDNVERESKIKESSIPFISDKYIQNISFLDKEDIINIDLLGSTKNTEVKAISWRSLADDIVELLIHSFNLQRDYSVNGRPFAYIPKLGFPANFLSMKLYDNYKYFIIYYYDDGESRRNPLLYVHGIWKIYTSLDF